MATRDLGSRHLEAQRRLRRAPAHLAQGSAGGRLVSNREAEALLRVARLYRGLNGSFELERPKIDPHVL